MLVQQLQFQCDDKDKLEWALVAVTDPFINGDSETGISDQFDLIFEMIEWVRSRNDNPYGYLSELQERLTVLGLLEASLTLLPSMLGLTLNKESGISLVLIRNEAQFSVVVDFGDRLSDNTVAGTIMNHKFENLEGSLSAMSRDGTSLSPEQINDLIRQNQTALELSLGISDDW